MSDILVIGEAFVDFLPKDIGPLSSMSSFEMHGGGAPCNVARGIARLGIESTLLSVMGDDAFSDFLIEQLQKDAVNTSGVRRLAGGRTQLCFITLDHKGDRHFNGRGPDASLSLGLQDIKPSLFTDPKALVITCGSLRTRQGVYAIERAMKSIKGWIVCDPGTCPPEWCKPDLMRKRLWGVFSRCEIVKCADHETYWLVEEDDPMKAAKRLIESGAQCAIVTCGAEGAAWAREKDCGFLPAPRVATVDTTGAGDAFLSALMASLIQSDIKPGIMAKSEWERHLLIAHHIAALAVTHKGAVHGIPYLENQEELHSKDWSKVIDALPS